MSLRIEAGPVLLEAVLREPRAGPPRGAAVLCHPHPRHGGTMNNRVIFRAGRAALAARLATLRFNFRGVGASTGSYDEGIGEAQDVSAALDWLHRRYPELPLALIGFSFGAWVGLRVACADGRVRATVGLGLPLSFYDFGFLAANPRPALYVAGTRDEFCPGAALEALARRLPPAALVRRVEGAGHFFADELDDVAAMITGFLGRQDWGAQ